jgi:hypothetical protein
VLNFLFKKIGKKRKMGGKGKLEEVFNVRGGEGKKFKINFFRDF